MTILVSCLALLFKCYIFLDDDIHLGIVVGTSVARILPLVALFQVFDGTVGVGCGILRAQGKQVRSHFAYATSLCSRLSLQSIAAWFNLT